MQINEIIFAQHTQTLGRPQCNKEGGGGGESTTAPSGQMHEAKQWATKDAQIHSTNMKKKKLPVRIKRTYKQYCSINNIFIAKKGLSFLVRLLSEAVIKQSSNNRHK